MDPDTLSTVSAILQKGGPVAVMFLVWIAYKTGVKASAGIESLRTIAENTTRIRDDTVTNGKKLDDLLARGK